MRARLLRIVTVLAVVVSSPVTLGSGPAQAAPGSGAAVPLVTTTHSFGAAEDSYVNAAASSRNYGTAPVLAVGAGPERISLLKFVVAGLTQPVASARLRLHTQAASDAGSPIGGTVRAVATSWAESTVTYATRPTPVGSATTAFSSVAPSTWYEVKVTFAVTGNGVVAFSISSANANGAYYDSRHSSTFTPQLLVDTGSPGSGSNVLLAAGDIGSCTGNGDEMTAQILDREPGTVVSLGDLTGDGSNAELQNCYAPTWGRHKDRTRPVPGNHDYLINDGAAYYNYFGAAAGPAGKGYYSYDRAGWHIVALNSLCSRVGGCQAGSAQEQWLRADLAAHPAKCTLAIWHHPLFASGGRESSSVRPFYQALYDAGVEVVLNGHNHQYERFAPQNPDGVAQPTRGIREFIVGTGGRSLQSDFADVQANSEVRNGTTFGVLKLTLNPDGYDWRFLSTPGQSFTDSGSGACH